MARSSSRPSLWPIGLFFLAGAAGAILWDLHNKVPAPGGVPSGSPAPPRRVAAPAPHDRGPSPAPRRAAATPRHKRGADSPRFEQVGVPVDSRETARALSSEELSEEQAKRILERLIESRGYYGISADCLSARPLGSQNASYGFEIVASNCESIARGSVIGRWRVEAKTGKASYRTSGGTYLPAP